MPLSLRHFDEWLCEGLCFSFSALLGGKEWNYWAVCLLKMTAGNINARMTRISPRKRTPRIIFNIISPVSPWPVFERDWDSGGIVRLRFKGEKLRSVETCIHRWRCSWILSLSASKTNASWKRKEQKKKKKEKKKQRFCCKHLHCLRMSLFFFLVLELHV